MRIAIVGWAFFGLTLVSLLGYVLNWGVFVGADVELQIFGGPPWPKYCYYLHLRGISQETAKVHVKNVLTKLGVSDRAAAVAEAMRQGVLN